MTDHNLNINLTELLITQIASLHKSKLFSDIILYVEGQKISAHRSIIGARCEYLNNFFATALNKPNQTKFELNVPLKPFEIILEYFYTGQINFAKIDDLEILLQILNLVEEYCLFYLKTHLEKYFNQILSVDNVCQLLEAASVYELKELEIESLKLIESNLDQILESESFKKISKKLLQKILTSNSFCPSSELCVFNALIEWSDQTNHNIETVLHLVNLSELPLKGLLKLRKSGTAEILLDSVQNQLIKKPVECSKILIPNANVATSKYNAQTIEGYMASELLNGNCVLYDDTIGYTRHTINQSNNSGITVELEKIFEINHIKILLWDRDDRIYSYFIEISTDQKKWKRLIDYSSYACRSWQNLYFPAEQVKYIKIIGTYCSQNENFDIVTLEAYYKENIPEIRNGFVVPNYNVALVSMGATVLEADRWDFEINDLINGVNSGRTMHRIQNGKSILIRLNQPFYISSIKLLLGEYRMYKFYIETSLNKIDWEKVVDETNEFVSSWQNFHFPSKLVLFIRIVGIEPRYSTYLTIRYFECPIEE